MHDAPFSTLPTLPGSLAALPSGCVLLYFLGWRAAVPENYLKR